jgi:YfiH family protein
MRLPSPSAAFRWSRETWGDALRCRPLESEAEHLFTTKQLQLRAGRHDEAWALVAGSLGTTVDRVFRVKQVHGNTVRVVRAGRDAAEDPSSRPEADAIVSDLPGSVLSVQVADCAPMLIVDARQKVAGAVHAGWRGTCAGVGAAAVSALSREFGSRPADLVVAFGPSIGACCYEVGDELVHAFRQAGAAESDLCRWFTRTQSGSLRLDLWAANRDQLARAGVAPDHIYLSRLCTQTHADLFDSYRVAGARAGRSIAAVRVPNG